MGLIGSLSLLEYSPTTQFPVDVFMEDWSAVERTIGRGEFELLASVSGLVAIVNRGAIRKLRLSRPVDQSIAKANEKTRILRETRGQLPLENLRRYLAGRKEVQRVYVMQETGPVPVKTGLWYWEFVNHLRA